MKRVILASGVLAACATAMPAHAAELRVGRGAERTSLFPDWFAATGNQQIASHVFDNLVAMDANSIPQGGS